MCLETGPKWLFFQALSANLLAIFVLNVIEDFYLFTNVHPIQGPRGTRGRGHPTHKPPI